MLAATQQQLIFKENITETANVYASDIHYSA